MNLEKEIFDISLNDIIPNRFQPREIFKDEELQELAKSIKEHGVIQPIIVRKIGDKYEIIAGERRYRASKLAGKETIPALVRNIDDKEAAKIALLENLQRSNLTPIEEAKTYQTILKIDNITQDELATNLGKSQSTIANKLRLLTLSEEVQTALLNSQISERHARSLLSLEPEKQDEMLHKIIDQKLTVRQLDEEIMKITGKAPVENAEPEEVKEEGGPMKVETFTENTEPKTEAVQPAQPAEPTLEKAPATPTVPVQEEKKEETVAQPEPVETTTPEQPTPEVPVEATPNTKPVEPQPETSVAPEAPVAPVQEEKKEETVAQPESVAPTTPEQPTPEVPVEATSNTEPVAPHSEAQPTEPQTEQPVAQPTTDLPVPEPEVQETPQVEPVGTVENPQVEPIAEEQPIQPEQVVAEQTPVETSTPQETPVEPTPAVEVQPMPEQSATEVPTSMPETAAEETIPTTEIMPTATESQPEKVAETPPATEPEAPMPEVEPVTEKPQPEVQAAPSNIFDKLRVQSTEPENKEPMTLPTPDVSSVINAQEENQNTSEGTNDMYDLRFAINNFRQAIQNTEKFGFKVNANEYDKGDKYQIVIDIDKK